MERVGLYPGTFDPITAGHLDIIGRALKLVDKLIIGVAVNEAKKPLFSLEERVAIVTEETAELHNPRGVAIEVRPFDNLLMHFAENCGAQVIIRGLRAVSDFEYEFQMTAMNEQLNREIETVFLMADVQHQAVASRLVKEIARFGGDITSFVTPRVREKLLEKYK
jgi:pantetheine-phosphate adenylyltransferase